MKQVVGIVGSGMVGRDPFDPRCWSRIAKNFFEAHGFVVLAPQVVTLRGEQFVNYRMERVVAEPFATPDRP